MKPTRREILGWLGGAACGAVVASVAPPIVKSLFGPEKIEGEDLIALLQSDFPDGLAGQILDVIEQGRKFSIEKYWIQVQHRNFGSIKDVYEQTYKLYENIPFVDDRYLGRLYVHVAVDKDGIVQHINLNYVGLIPTTEPGDRPFNENTGVFNDIHYRYVRLFSEYDGFNKSWENRCSWTFDSIPPLVTNNNNPGHFIEICRKYNLS